jgi:hypothetical protein
MYLESKILYENFVLGFKSRFQICPVLPPPFTSLDELWKTVCRMLLAHEFELTFNVILRNTVVVRAVGLFSIRNFFPVVFVVVRVVIAVLSLIVSQACSMAISLWTSVSSAEQWSSGSQSRSTHRLHASAVTFSLLLGLRCP